jgi:hypothetical protein
VSTRLASACAVVLFTPRTCATHINPPPQNVGSADDIDKGMRLGTNQPMGPLRLADFIGECGAWLVGLVGLVCVLPCARLVAGRRRQVEQAAS